MLPPSLDDVPFEVPSAYHMCYHRGLRIDGSKKAKDVYAELTRCTVSNIGHFDNANADLLAYLAGRIGQVEPKAEVGGEETGNREQEGTVLGERQRERVELPEANLLTHLEGTRRHQAKAMLDAVAGAPTGQQAAEVMRWLKIMRAAHELMHLAMVFTTSRKMPSHVSSTDVEAAWDVLMRKAPPMSVAACLMGELEVEEGGSPLGRGEEGMSPAAAADDADESSYDSEDAREGEESSSSEDDRPSSEDEPSDSDEDEGVHCYYPCDDPDDDGEALGTEEGTRWTAEAAPEGDRSTGGRAGENSSAEECSTGASESMRAKHRSSEEADSERPKRNILIKATGSVQKYGSSSDGVSREPLSPMVNATTDASSAGGGGNTRSPRPDGPTYKRPRHQ